jgi:hypothetical protein
MTGVIINFMCASLVDWRTRKRPGFAIAKVLGNLHLRQTHNEGGRVVRELLADGSTPN